MNKLPGLENKDWILILFISIITGTAGLSARAFRVSGEIVILVTLAMIAVWLTLLALFLFRRLQKEIRIEANHVEATITLNTVIAPRLPLPAFGGTAIEADTARELVSLILQERPRLVVECGSGLSTLLVGYALERVGKGRILSMEHNADWVNITRNRLEQHGLQPYATVLHAPLEETKLPGRGIWKWYDPKCWEDWNQIDLVIVDGPPSWKNHSARYPALPLLWDRLNDGSVIFLDDSARSGEEAIIADWLSLYPDRLVKKTLETSKGLILLTVSK
jgi:predicted O-methyltransferase YrrM